MKGREALPVQDEPLERSSMLLTLIGVLIAGLLTMITFSLQTVSDGIGEINQTLISFSAVISENTTVSTHNAKDNDAQWGMLRDHQKTISSHLIKDAEVDHTHRGHRSPDGSFP